MGKRSICRLLALLGSLTMLVGAADKKVPVVKAEGTGMELTDLRVNHLRDTEEKGILGTDQTPVFSWVNEMDGYNRAVSRYQVILASTEEKAENGRGDVWDSGQVAGSSTAEIVYEGPALKSKTAYFWRARIWDETGRASNWSRTARFETGILHGEEWQGSWIGASTQAPALTQGRWIWRTDGAPAGQIPAAVQYFRGRFQTTSEKTVASAILSCTADDYGTVYLNGKPAVDISNQAGAWMSGGAADVTSFLRPGENVLAARVTNTESGFAGFIAVMNIRYTDGTQETFATGSGWRCASSAPETFAEPGFDDRSWLSPDQAIAYGGDPWGERVHLTLSGAAAPRLRKSFSVDKEVRQARAYVCGLGLFELTVNGVQPDDTVLNPAHTQYNKTVMYRVFDVTERLRPGENVLGVELGKSWLNETCNLWGWDQAVWRDDPKLLMELTLTYADGTSETLSTGEDWLASVGGPTLYNSILFGEEYDARRAQPGWNLPGGSTAGWEKAVLAREPGGGLTAQNIPPIRRVRTLDKTVTRLGDGRYIVSLPEMTTGWAAVTFRGLTEGRQIVLSYGETLNADGSLFDFTNMGMFGRTLQQDIYTAAGAGEETFEPKFSYKGYQYMQIEGYDGELRPEDVICYQLRNDVEVTSALETGNELVNTLHDNMVRTMLNNFQSKPTDTPVWEKNGYTGDNNITMETFAYNLDISAFIPKYLGDVRDTQDDRGVVPDIAPCAPNWGYTNIPVWNTVYTTGVYDMQRYFAQDSLTKEHYASMKKLVDNYLTEMKTTGWIWDYPDQLADWVSPAGTDPNAVIQPQSAEGSYICSNAYLYLAVSRLAEMADACGYEEDAAGYRQAAGHIRTAFNRKFYKPEEQIYDTGWWDGSRGDKTRYRQTSNLLPLALGMVEEENRAGVLRNLVADIEAKSYHLDTGMVGTKYLLPVLTENGYADVAYKILTQNTYPSWGYWVEQGATTTWELYENTTRSRDHFFLGTYDEYLFKYLAGIREVKDGYETVSIRPVLLKGIGHVDASLYTVRGKLASRWALQDGGTAALSFTIPAGCTAVVDIPSDDGVVTAGGSGLDAHPGVRKFEKVEGAVRVTIGSGQYTFFTTVDPERYERHVLKLEAPQGIDATVTVDGTEYTLPAALRVTGGVHTLSAASNDARYAFSHWQGTVYAGENPIDVRLLEDSRLEAVFAYTGGETAGETVSLSLSVPEGGVLRINGKS